LIEPLARFNSGRRRADWTPVQSPGADTFVRKLRAQAEPAMATLVEPLLKSIDQFA
jgi:hypothetical protein